MADPYLDGTFRWWHLARPSPELLAANDVGWLGRAGVVADLGCGLGTEIGYLAGRGWRCVGVDLSAAAVSAAAASHPGARFARADVLCLPIADAAADLLVDRGCFHCRRWPARASDNEQAGDDDHHRRARILAP